MSTGVTYVPYTMGEIIRNLRNLDFGFLLGLTPADFFAFIVMALVMALLVFGLVVNLLSLIGK